MAQGAATSMEDGAFLGRVLAHVVNGNLNLEQAINIYEKTRMPLAYYKQQVSFLNGAIWHLPDGPLQGVSPAFLKKVPVADGPRLGTRPCRQNSVGSNFCGRQTCMEIHTPR